MDRALGIMYTVAVVVALWSAGLELGIRHTAGDVLAPLRRRGLLVRVAAVEVVIFPLLVWALVHLFAVPGGYATGLLLVGVASAGPLGLKAAQLADADATTAFALIVVLELANIAAIPFWAALLLPAGTSLELGQMVGTLLALVLLPIGLGLAVKRYRLVLSARLPSRLGAVATVATLVAVGAVVARDGDVVWRALRERVPAVAVIAVVAALVLGWLAGGPARQTRWAAALVTGIRANAVALAIAATSFPDSAEVRAGVVAFGLVSITVPLVVAAIVKRGGLAEAPRVLSGSRAQA